LGSQNLQSRQFCNGAAQQLSLLLAVLSSGIASTFQRIEERA
jgi:hypothetical protein